MATMHESSATLLKYLDSQGVPYTIVPHERDYTAQRTAADTRTPGRQFAKCVLVWGDNYHAMVVIPADRHIDFAMLTSELDAVRTGLVREEEMLRLFPNCELGAEPPFGNLYDLPVFVDGSLAGQEMITFNAGNHDEAVRMKMADFMKLTEPTVIDCTTKPGE